MQGIFTKGSNPRNDIDVLAIQSKHSQDKKENKEKNKKKKRKEKKRTVLRLKDSKRSKRGNLINRYKMSYLV